MEVKNDKVKMKIFIYSPKQINVHSLFKWEFHTIQKYVFDISHTVREWLPSGM